ncbi:MAG TPA: LuxR C-terminal-related transcriptional regulator [Thermoleophilaceae bacterium]|nr:LuxR C-terminal-related transcriptional regulator [Thermoleophilaceae bacterium]
MPRPRLVRALMAPDSRPLAVVIAPAGYGKTTLLAEWASHEERPFAWITTEERFNDPEALRTAVDAALDEVEGRGPFVLALDDTHLLHEPASLEVLHDLVARMPRESRLAIAARTEPPVSLGRMRAHREVAEVRMRALAMTVPEAAALLALADVPASPAEVEALVERTEGWAAGIYLAAVTLRDQGATAGSLDGFGGHDSAVADYYRDEYLKKLAPDLVAFLRSCAVLDVLSAPACDAVLERSDSGQLLAEVARRNVMLSAVDRTRESFRLHRLFRETLLGELRRLWPELEPRLHARASEWFEAQGDDERAVRHAGAAGDATRAGELLWRNLPRWVGGGRNDAVRTGLGAFTDERIAGDPRLSLAAAHSNVASGDLDAALHFKAAAERTAAESPRDDPDLAPALSLLRAAVADDDVAAMGAQAERACEIDAEDSEWRPTGCLLSGVARHLAGDLDGATPALEEAARRGVVGAPHVQALALAQLALAAVDLEDWELAATRVHRATAQLDAYGLDSYPTSALPYAVAAYVRARRGQVEQARADFARADELLAELPGFLAWYVAETRVALARAAMKLGETGRARTLAAEAARVASAVPDAVTLHRWVEDLGRSVEAAAAAAAPDHLTAAELRVLALLPTHLSFREIGEQLYVTANTVKTQAYSVYRKFGASSRSEAVTRAAELGLVGSSTAVAPGSGST